MTSVTRICLALLFCTTLNDHVAWAQTRAESGETETGESILSEFYKPDDVQSVHLKIAEPDRQQMLEALPERIYVPGQFRWRDTVIEEVGVRFKGNSSSNPHQNHKRSYLIRFNKYRKKQRFLGLRRASFDNGIQFGSVFSEPIITEILQDLGIRTHRANYARLYVNDEYQGVYVNVERIDQSFIDRVLPDPDGSLYKVDEGGAGGNLQWVGENPSVYRKTFEAQANSSRQERARLLQFIRMINQAKPEEIRARLESDLELEDFLQTTAVLLLAGAFDQLTGWNPHNYYLYRDGISNRWRYLPWDLDVGFSEVAFGRVHVLADWNAAWPVPATGAPNPLLERIIADPQLLDRYRQHARAILEKYFEPERLCGIVDQKYALIRKDLESDPFPHRRVTNPTDDGYESIVVSIKDFIRKRYAAAKEQLEHPGSRPKVVRRPNGGGRPGVPPQFVARIRELERRVQQMRQKGHDVRPIRQVMQRVGPLIQQGTLKEAGKLIDEALELARGGAESSKKKQKPTEPHGTGAR